MNQLLYSGNHKAIKSWIVFSFLIGFITCQSAIALEVKVTQNTAKLMPYQVFELTFQHQGKYANPTWDITIDVQFNSTSGKKYKVGGFFYGSSKRQVPTTQMFKNHRGRDRERAIWPCEPADLFKARYAPSEVGNWTYEYIFQNNKGERATGSGTFLVVKGRKHQKGWLRINPNHPLRFIHDDGSPYYPLGFQDCAFDHDNNGSAIDEFGMDGAWRTEITDNRPDPPPGPLYARGPNMSPHNGDVYFRRHAEAGFNMWRFSPNNCTIKLFAKPDDPNTNSFDHVRWEQAIMIDEMLMMTRKYGIRNMYGIFGFMPVFNKKADDAQGMAKVKRFIKYSVDRWGAYVDIWELLNEQPADEEWYAITIPYLKSIDPYRRLVTTSWEKPHLEGIDINAPHWYQNENELDSDHFSRGRTREAARYNKPVIYGEQGNSIGKSREEWLKYDIPKGIGGVWDIGSARRMRVRSWAVMFAEGSFIFWETSYTRDSHFMNIWLGPQERQYIRALQDFSYRLDTGIKRFRVSKSGAQANQVTAHGLRSDECAAIYFHHHVCAECPKNPTKEEKRKHLWEHDRGKVTDLKVTVNVPKAGKGYWYDPLDADIIASFDAPAGEHTFTVPPFTIDLALLITDKGPPDIDGDGIPNDLDDDDDNDGVPDTKDAYPLEREEWADADNDRIGDNMDADIGGDGVGDDLNNNGIADHEELDIDGDGVKKVHSIPWDAFPRDPNEWRDTDGDGIGDNADTDDDGDGFTDAQEITIGTDPLDPVSFP